LPAVEIDQLILQVGIGGRYLVSQLDPLLRHQKKGGSGPDRELAVHETEL
jgi:hypothetical protein